MKEKETFLIEVFEDLGDKNAKIAFLLWNAYYNTLAVYNFHKSLGYTQLSTKKQVWLPISNDISNNPPKMIFSLF